MTVRTRSSTRKSVAISLLLASTLAACATQKTSSTQGPQPTTVLMALVKQGDIATYATFDGQVAPLYQTTLSTAEAGTLATVDVTEGDFVHRGQLLATLNISQLAAQLQANEAMVRSDEAQVDHNSVAAPVNAQQYTSAVAAARQNVQAAANSVQAARAALAQDELTERADRSLLAQGYVSAQSYQVARANYVSAREALTDQQQTVTAQQAALKTAYSNTNQRSEDQAIAASPGRRMARRSTIA